MYERFLRLIGKTVAFIGMILILFPVGFFILYIGEANHPFNPPSIYIAPMGFLVMIILISFGFILTSTGMYIYKSFPILIPFLTKDGEPIHSAKSWKKGSESGLFLTSCGLIVSINQESEETAHVGYRVISTKQATHRECVEMEGKVGLDGFSKHRSC